MIAALALIAAVLALPIDHAEIETPGIVTQVEFDQAQVGMPKHQVHELWGARGEFAVTYYDETGDEHRVRRYYRPDHSDFLVDFQRKLNHKVYRFDHWVESPTKSS